MNVDDRLRRRLRDADPLAAMDAATPDTARLDARMEQIMQADQRPSRALLRPRALGLTALTAAGLAAVLVVGSLVRPAASAMAWDPSPVAGTAAQAAQATSACAAGLPDNPGGNPVVVGGDGGEVPPLPAIPAALPPLVHLELHGTGGVAIFADEEVTAYCLLVANGDSLAFANLLFPDLGNGAAAGAGTIIGSTVGAGSGGPSSGMVAIGNGGFLVTAMAATYGTKAIGIIAGEAPAGSTSIRITGGPADGATATVDHGRFALWAPDSVQGADVTVTARNAAGTSLGSVTLGAPAGAPDDPVVTTELTPKP